ncbi:MAG TPA: MFS transporter [Gammaproteobacteria bacterium]
MSNPYFSVAAVIAGVTLFQGANGLLAVLLPLRMEAAGFSLVEIGQVGSAHGLGFLLGCLLVPRLIAGVGHIRAFALFAALLAVTLMSFPAWISPWAWAGLRFVGAACFAGLFTVAESWIADRTGSAERGRVLGFYMVCHKAALAGMPLLLLGADLGGPGFFMLASALCSLALVPVAASRGGHPAPVTLETLGLRRLYAIAPVGVVGCFATGLINAPVIALAPVYGTGVGLSLGLTTLLLPAMQFGSLLFQWPIGHLSARGDRRRVILGLELAVLALSLLLLFGRQLPTDALPWLFLAWGAAALSVYAICIAHASDLARPEQLVPLVSSLLLAWGAGAVLGPLLVAWSMAAFGDEALFGYAALIAAGFSVFLGWRMRRRQLPADQPHAPFVNLPATSTAVAEFAAPAVPAAGADGRQARAAEE